MYRKRQQHHEAVKLDSEQRSFDDTRRDIYTREDFVASIRAKGKGELRQRLAFTEWLVSPRLFDVFVPGNVFVRVRALCAIQTEVSRGRLVPCFWTADKA